MRARALLIVTAIVSSILGATVVWLVLTVPNDLEAGALMQQAKKDIDARQNDRAREKLTKIVQQYPRTDAAAAATVALVRLADLSPRQGQVVELRYFGGMTEEEVADVLHISSRTVRHDWKLARAWLYRELSRRTNDA